MKQECQAKQDLKESQHLMRIGNYQASLKKYQQVAKVSLQVRAQALFQMGIICTHPNNINRDYQKALYYFQKIVKEYPNSSLKEEAETLSMLITDVISRDKKIKKLQGQLEAMEKQIEQMKKVDLTVEEKKRKRLPQ